MNKELLKDAIALMLITIVAGCLLGVVHMVTEKPIALQQEKTKQETYQNVFPEAKSFIEVKEHSNELVQKALKEQGLEQYNNIDEFLAVSDSENASADANVIGYVMTITNSEGYGGDITFTIGLTLDGTVKDIAFTALNETAGLGMKAAEESFISQYRDKQVESYMVTKSGAAADGEIDALSGATITSSAVTNGVNAGLAYYRYFTGGDKNE